MEVKLTERKAATAWSAANVVRGAWGPAGLEAALCKGPMVVVYRLGFLTAWVLTRLNLVKSKFFAQPILLAVRRVLGEYFQNQISPESTAAESLRWLTSVKRGTAWVPGVCRIPPACRRTPRA